MAIRNPVRPDDETGTGGTTAPVRTLYVMSITYGGRARKGRRITRTCPPDPCFRERAEARTDGRDHRDRRP
ncbi:hypothetical protein SHKM778_00070 [Streptomyces sp. KM77-8]|uniref:Mobile element transfer n=1 Tax=Streptomyces haneummycinicus TaxID=3074435 RepID=A0AAT9H8E3_9ACTN